MAEIDLSDAVPPTARWVKLHYKMEPKTKGARLVARLWSGETNEHALVIKGKEGDAFVKMERPQKLSVQHPVNISLQLKVTAYKSTPH